VLLSVVDGRDAQRSGNVAVHFRALVFALKAHVVQAREAQLQRRHPAEGGGIGEDDERLAAMRGLDRFAHGAEVVAVDPDHLGAEGFHLGPDVAHIHHAGHGAVALLAVDVHDRIEVVDPVMGGGLDRLPGLALLQFAVGHVDPDAAGLALAFAAPGKPCAGRQPDPQRAVVHFHARRVLGADLLHA
jgi:hypothetical protein